MLCEIKPESSNIQDQCPKLLLQSFSLYFPPLIFIWLWI